MSTCLLTTSFALLREHRACEPRYRHLLKALGGVRRYGSTRAIPLTRVLTLNGLDDALWALRAVLPEQRAARDLLARLLACDYAEHVLPVWTAVSPDDPRPADTIAVARRYARGEATAGELATARSSAYAAADAAHASHAAAYASHAAADAAHAASAAARAAMGIALSATYASHAATHAALSATGRAAGIAAEKAERAWQAERLRRYLVGELCAGTEV